MSTTTLEAETMVVDRDNEGLPPEAIEWLRTVYRDIGALTVQYGQKVIPELIYRPNGNHLGPEQLAQIAAYRVRKQNGNGRKGR